MLNAKFTQSVKEINRWISAVHTQILAALDEPKQWYNFFHK
jgi:hypothetical protein